MQSTTDELSSSPKAGLNEQCTLQVPSRLTSVLLGHFFVGGVQSLSLQADYPEQLRVVVVRLLLLAGRLAQALEWRLFASRGQKVVRASRQPRDCLVIWWRMPWPFQRGLHSCCNTPWPRGGNQDYAFLKCCFQTFYVTGCTTNYNSFTVL